MGFLQRWETDDSQAYALYCSGHTRLAAGDAQGAADALERALAYEPRKASLHEALGRAYFALARVDRAREAFEHALELDPTNDYAHFSLGRCHERQGRLADAAKHLKLACALADRDDYSVALGRVRTRLGA